MLDLELYSRAKDFNWGEDAHEEYPLLRENFPLATADQFQQVQASSECLRDGAQAGRHHPTVAEACEYLHSLHEIGVERAVVGMVHPDPDKPINRFIGETLKYMRDNLPDMIPVVLSRALEPDTIVASNLAEINDKLRTIVFQSLAPTRRALHRWEEDVILNNLGERIEFLTKQGKPVVAYTEQTSNTPPETLNKFVGMAIQAGAEVIGIADTFGGLFPPGTYRLVSAVRSMCDEQAGGKAVKLEFHPHNDWGHALENMHAALSGGASIMSAVIAGFGERAGNGPLCQWLYFTNEMLERYRLPPRYNLGRLKETAEYLATILGESVPPRAPLVGSNTHLTYAGIHADFFVAIERRRMEIMTALENGLISPEEAEEASRFLDERLQQPYSSVDPESVGAKISFGVGPSSGRANVELVLWRLGYPVDFADKNDPRLEAVLAVAQSEWRVLTDEEIRRIVDKP